MTPDHDLTGSLRDTIAEHHGTGTPLEIRGTGSKAFLGRRPAGTPLSTTGHRGIISYEPTELVVRVRAGTALAELEQTLVENGQFLPCEPPVFGSTGTVGGAVACGLSGPRRPYAGAIRDFMLGVTMVNGEGKVLTFGGQVMKNVAGYDAFRLQAGAYGTLGLLLDVSFKVLPGPENERTLCFEMAEDRALEAMNRWAGEPLPLSAAAWHDGLLRVRLSGTESGITEAAARLGGENRDDGFWLGLRNQELPFFSTGGHDLWRLSVPPATPPLGLPGKTLVDWGGGQRWLVSDQPAAAIRTALEPLGGFAHLFRSSAPREEVFHPLDPGLARLHHSLRQAFDPRGVLNPGRMYADL